MRSYTDKETGATVTEEMIERMVESKINSLDRKFMNSDMSQEVYDLKMRQIKNWTREQYDLIDGVATTYEC